MRSRSSATGLALAATRGYIHLFRLFWAWPVAEAGTQRFPALYAHHDR